jgi:hypothetical protein
MKLKPLSAVFQSIGKMLSFQIEHKNFRKYLSKIGTQGTAAHFALPRCAVTADLQLNKGTRKGRFFHNYLSALAAWTQIKLFSKYVQIFQICFSKIIAL